jgi:preprotein translocase subunit SecD
MCRSACIVAALIFGSSGIPVSAQDKTPVSPHKLPAGVYVVLRENRNEKQLRPLRDGEALVVHHHRYVKQEDREPPLFVVVRSTPDVALDLAEPPKAVQEGGEVVRIFLKLKPKAGAALERVTTNAQGKQLAIVLDGEVVTIHKIRQTIPGGEVQISSCAAGAAKHLLERLHARQAKK